MFYGMEEKGTEEESQETETWKNISESAAKHGSKSTHHDNMNTGVKV